MENSNKISKWFTPMSKIIKSDVPSFRNSETVRISKNEKTINVVTLAENFVKSRTKTIPSRIVAKFNGIQRLFTLDSGNGNAIVYKSIVGDRLVLVNNFDKKLNRHI